MIYFNNNKKMNFIKQNLKKIIAILIVIIIGLFAAQNMNSSQDATGFLFQRPQANNLSALNTIEMVNQPIFYNIGRNSLKFKFKKPLNKKTIITFKFNKNFKNQYTKQLTLKAGSKGFTYIFSAETYNYGELILNINSKNTNLRFSNNRTNKTFSFQPNLTQRTSDEESNPLDELNANNENLETLEEDQEENDIELELLDENDNEEENNPLDELNANNENLETLEEEQEENNIELELLEPSNRFRFEFSPRNNTLMTGENEISLSIESRNSGSFVEYLTISLEGHEYNIDQNRFEIKNPTTDENYNILEITENEEENISSFKILIDEEIQENNSLNLELEVYGNTINQNIDLSPYLEINVTELSFRNLNSYESIVINPRGARILLSR
ncbi:hypothetical protein CL656_01310 [bacterium]|nr:hypothetical protein [bacterium]